MRLLLVLSTVLLFTSCDLLVALAEPPAPEKSATSYLKLTNRTYHGIFHDNIYLSGSIENTHYCKTIGPVILTATITKENGTVEKETVSITAIDSGSSTTFEKKIYVPDNVRIELEITAACYK